VVFLLSCATQEPNQYPDIEPLKINENGDVITLTLAQAMDYAIENNLDAQVSELRLLASRRQIGLEKLQAFPQAELTGRVSGRSNRGASSSRSILSGQQSLEPSFSSDQITRFYQLQTTWNTIDVALAVLNSKTASDEAKVVAYQHQKVKNNIRRDVFIAYVSSLFAQEIGELIPLFERQAEKTMQSIRTASAEQLMSKEQAFEASDAILSSLREIRTRHEELQGSVFELKSLLGLSPGTEIRLSKEGVPKYEDLARTIGKDVADLELMALKNRPEVQESKLNIDIAKRSRRQEIWGALPGGEFVLAWNRDSNSFLNDDRWVNYSASLVQSLVNLMTLPANLRWAQTEIDLEEKRYEALALAVMFQVHLAYRQIEFAQDLYGGYEANDGFFEDMMTGNYKRYDMGMLSKYSLFQAMLEETLREIDMRQARHELYDAYLQMQDALGKTDFLKQLEKDVT